MLTPSMKTTSETIVKGGITMVVGIAIGTFFGFAIVSGIVTWLLGLDEEAMQYDWRREQWVFVPERYDMMLEKLIRK